MVMPNLGLRIQLKFHSIVSAEIYYVTSLMYYYYVSKNMLYVTGCINRASLFSIELLRSVRILILD